MGTDGRIREAALFWVGTSGWHYRDWEGGFYPASLPTLEWLSFYATRFPTVELNNSFYRLPDRGTFESWARQVPDGFLMTVKASRYLTHIRRLIDPREPLERLWTAAQGLGSYLGPVLFQLPPTFVQDVDRLRGLLQVLPGKMRPAFEFRHPSWFAWETYDLLDDAGAALVWADQPGKRLGAVPMTGGWATSGSIGDGVTAPGYSCEKLVRWADRLAALDARDVLAYFNNDQRAAAPHDAQVLQRLLAERGASIATSRAAA